MFRVYASNSDSASLALLLSLVGLVLPKRSVHSVAVEAVHQYKGLNSKVDARAYHHLLLILSVDLVAALSIFMERTVEFLFVGYQKVEEQESKKESQEVEGDVKDPENLPCANVIVESTACFQLVSPEFPFGGKHEVEHEWGTAKDNKMQEGASQKAENEQEETKEPEDCILKEYAAHG